MSTPKSQITSEQMRVKFTRFRILVVGRANAGKTTILRRLCGSDTTEKPTIFSPNGKRIKSSTLDPSLKRGGHDIEKQMIFKGNPGFIFHDSCGFEAGGAQESKLVQQFIEQRSNAIELKEQLHAIWYCIPTTDDRPITAAEKKFFNECGTGLVPVIVLWTKTEALDLVKIKQLMKEGNSKSEAMQQAPQKAWADFENKFYPCFDKFKYPPKAYVVFRKMHQPGGNCNDLIDKTVAALSSEELQQLFLSTQQNHIESCIKYGITKMVNGYSAEAILLKHLKHKFNHMNWASFMAIGLRYFPQFVSVTLDFKCLRLWTKIYYDSIL